MTNESVNVNINILTVHLQSEQLTFQLSIDYCPPGYELRSRAGTEDLLSCTCLDSTFSILGCDDRRNVIILKVWNCTRAVFAMICAAAVTIYLERLLIYIVIQWGNHRFFKILLHENKVLIISSMLRMFLRMGCGLA